MNKNRFKKSEDPIMYDAYQKYIAHVGRCIGRKDRQGIPIEMKLTFDEWWKLWTDSGKWDQRGRKGIAFCMARKDDLGHYEMGNVEIITKSENTGRYNHRTFGLPRLRRKIRLCPHCGGDLILKRGNKRNGSLAFTSKAPLGVWHLT